MGAGGHPPRRPDLPPRRGAGPAHPPRAGPRHGAPLRGRPDRARHLGQRRRSAARAAAAARRRARDRGRPRGPALVDRRRSPPVRAPATGEGLPRRDPGPSRRRQSGRRGAGRRLSGHRRADHHRAHPLPDEPRPSAAARPAAPAAGGPATGRQRRALPRLPPGLGLPGRHPRQGGPRRVRCVVPVRPPPPAGSLRPRRRGRCGEPRAPLRAGARCRAGRAAVRRDRRRWAGAVGDRRRRRAAAGRRARDGPAHRAPDSPRGSRGVARRRAARDQPVRDRRRGRRARPQSPSRWRCSNSSCRSCRRSPTTRRHACFPDGQSPPRPSPSLARC